ncbi:MAG TPA: hypothetical protein VN943_10870 [Candidatus Acidoferrum sp.]|nr:hypothetical protein [Candidatus Acidoferrum sp.]
MLKSLVLGAVLGGITAFLWSFISWSVLPWHQKQLRSFQNEDEVSAVIASHAAESGNYLLPTAPPQEGMNSEQKKAAEEVRMQKMQKGPLMFAAIRKEGFGSFPKVLITQLLCQMFAALLLTWLLLQTTGLSYVRRVAFLAVCGLAASVIADLPNWNWWGYSGAYTAVNVVDYTLTWLLAGLVIAKVANTAKPQTA